MPRFPTLADSSPDILTLLMSAHDDNGQQLTDVELRDQVSPLLLGYETTAALLWRLFDSLLTRGTPKLRAELDTLPAPEPEVITRLPYLTAVCQETLRIYLIGLICVPRMVKEPMQVGLRV